MPTICKWEAVGSRDGASVKWQMGHGEETGLGGNGSSTEGTWGVRWGECGAVGAFCCIFVQQLSKTIFLASHCTTEMEEAAVWSMNLHENQCGQPKREIDAAGWWGRSGSLREGRGGRELWREGGGAKEFTEVHKSGLHSSWAGPRGGVEVGALWEGKQRGEVSWCGNEEVPQSSTNGDLKACTNGGFWIKAPAMW